MAAAAGDETKKAFEAQVKAFLADSGKEKLEFPTTLSIEERRMVHDLAYDNDLCKQSRGPKNGGRFM